MTSYNVYGTWFLRKVPRERNVNNSLPVVYANVHLSNNPIVRNILWEVAVWSLLNMGNIHNYLVHTGAQVEESLNNLLWLFVIRD